MNQERADLANECQACSGKESDLSVDLIKKISVALSGWSRQGPAPRGTHSFSKSSRILLVSTVYQITHRPSSSLSMSVVFDKEIRVNSV